MTAHVLAFALQPPRSYQRSIPSHFSSSQVGGSGRQGSPTLSPVRRVARKRAVLCVQKETAQESADTDAKPADEAIQTPASAIDEVIKAGQSTPPGENETIAKKRYSLRTRLREETEAPFRKARMFVYGGSAVSAGVGSFIAGLRIIAALVGISGTQPLNETVPNVAINLGVVGLCSFLLRTEVKAGERRLERMSRGARIAALRVEDAATRQVLRLKDLRGRSRVVLVAGTAEKVSESMLSAEELKEGLSKSNLVIVPYIAKENSSMDSSGRNWRLVPYGLDDWQTWFEGERDVAKARLGPKAEELLVIVIRLDGKVGARSVGAPTWSRLVDEIAKMPVRDPYGKP